MDKMANRRLKLFLVWLVSAFLVVVFQTMFKTDVGLATEFIKTSGMVMLVVVGGLSATDAVNSYTAMKK